MACPTSAVPSVCLQPSASQQAKQVRGLDFSGYLIADLAGTRSIQPNLHFKYFMYICSMLGFWHRSDVYFRLQVPVFFVLLGWTLISSLFLTCTFSLLYLPPLG